MAGEFTIDVNAKGGPLSLSSSFFRRIVVCNSPRVTSSADGAEGSFIASDPAWISLAIVSFQVSRCIPLIRANEISKGLKSPLDDIRAR